MPINETYALVPGSRFHIDPGRRGLGVVEPAAKQRYGKLRAR